MSMLIELTDEIEDSFIAWLIVSKNISLKEYKKLSNDDYILLLRDFLVFHTRGKHI